MKVKSVLDKYNGIIFLVSIILIIICLLITKSNKCICDECICKEVVTDYEYTLNYITSNVDKTYTIEKIGNRYNITSEDESYYIYYTEVYKCGRVCSLYNDDIIDMVDNKMFILDYVLESNDIIDDTIEITKDEYKLIYKKNT